jgi:D-allose transport system substrate-binding protein
MFDKQGGLNIISQRRVSRRTLFCATLAAGTLWLVGSTSSVNAASPQEKYFFILPSLANPYWQTVKQGIEDASRSAGINATVLAPASDQAKEEFVNLCQAAITQNATMLAVCTTSDTVTLQCLREAQSRKIKVATVDIVIPDESLQKSGVKLSFSVGSDNRALGKQAADFVAGQNKLTVPKVLVLEGVVGNTNSADRVAGFKQELSAKVPKAQVVNTISAEWDRLKALHITADTLTRTPDLNVVFAANDMMALGAAEAIRLAGKTQQIAVVGIDGVPDARKAVEAGRLTASIAQLPYLIGKRSVELSKDSVAGKCSGVKEKTPLLVITKASLASKSDPLFKYVR